MNFFNRILHYYIYDMRLKKKLVVSHTILFLIPTAVLICFLFLNIFRIVMDDTIRSEQALSSQSPYFREFDFLSGILKSLRAFQNLFFHRKKSREEAD